FRGHWGRRGDSGGRRRWFGCNDLRHRLFGVLGGRIGEAQIEIVVERRFSGCAGKPGGLWLFDRQLFDKRWFFDFGRLVRANVEVHVDIG
ncbi:hypothetical protein, partial [Mesorhizobium sp.]|uniref:hypothetical protein n=1 Tax=Mesorhizobium sp. TaxID=1871066 RepID=UPI00344B6E2E